MAIELRVPALGESITQATVGAWLKHEGERVELDEPLVEVESEKATVALPAPLSGVLRRILKPQGATVAVGEIIGELEQGESASASPLTPALSQGEREKEASAPPLTPTLSQGERVKVTTGIEAPVPPSVRRFMAEHALRRSDLLHALDGGSAPARFPGPAPAPVPAPVGQEERLVPMTPLRRTVARRLLEAQQAAAILTTFNEVDMSAVMALRERHQAAFQEKHGVKLGFMSFFVKAVVEALKTYPIVNAEVRGDQILYKDHFDIGVAVGGGKGLVVPVVRDADRLDFAEVELQIAELAKKARENRITMDDLAGGTFTISNGGVYGSLLSTPILNPPQSAILGLHKIEKRAVVGEGDAIQVRPMMYVALSYDHRIIDGREAVSFLVRVKECIEAPERILLGV